MAGSFVFPSRLFAPDSLRLRPLGQALNGGASLSGEQSFADVSGGGRWVADFGESALWDVDQVLAWQALESFCDGGAQPLIVPVANRLLQPTSAVFPDTETFGLDTWVTDVTAWTATEVTAATTATAALGATTLSFTCTSPKPLKRGMGFSILHATWSWRFYRIARVTAGGLGTGDATTVIIRTPLRESVASDTALNFDTPRFVARVDGDISATVQLNKYGKAQARFIEYPRAP